MTAPATILPDPARLQLIHLAATVTAITAVVATTTGSALRPLCGWPSGRMHSHYARSVTDVPWHGVLFRLRPHARRFFCDEPTCARVFFAERLPGLVAPHARFWEARRECASCVPSGSSRRA